MAIVINPYTCTADGIVSYLLQCSTTHRFALIDPPREDTACWQGINACIDLEPDGVLSWIFLTRIEPHTLETCAALKRRHLCAQIAAPAGQQAHNLDRALHDGEQIVFGHCFGRVHFAHAPVVYQFDNAAFSLDASAVASERRFATRAA